MSIPTTSNRQPPQIIMLVLNDVRHDSRVRREASALTGAGYRVLVVGTHNHDSSLPDDEAVAGWHLRRFRYGRVAGWLRRRGIVAALRHIWQAAALLRYLHGQQPAVWHAHDFPALLLVMLARTGRRQPGGLVYDSHELFFHRHAPPQSLVRRGIRRATLWLEGTLARRADRIITVSPDFADFMAREWHVPTPAVILNGAMPPADFTPLPRPDGARLWLVHTGTLLARGRRLADILTELVNSSPDVHLTFVGDGPLLPVLRQQATHPALVGRVHFAPPVPPGAVSAAIRKADAALVAFNTTTPGYALTLPNKLFEAIAAGLPVIAADTPAIRAFLDRHPAGILWNADQPGDLARCINQISDHQGSVQRRQDMQQTQQVIGWPSQAAQLGALYGELLSARQKTTAV